MTNWEKKNVIIPLEIGNLPIQKVLREKENIKKTKKNKFREKRIDPVPEMKIFHKNKLRLNLLKMNKVKITVLVKNKRIMLINKWAMKLNKKLLKSLKITQSRLLKKIDFNKSKISKIFNHHLWNLKLKPKILKIYKKPWLLFKTLIIVSKILKNKRKINPCNNKSLKLKRIQKKI